MIQTSKGSNLMDPKSIKVNMNCRLNYTRFIMILQTKSQQKGQPKRFQVDPHVHFSKFGYQQQTAKFGCNICFQNGHVLAISMYQTDLSPPGLAVLREGPPMRRPRADGPAALGAAASRFGAKEAIQNADFNNGSKA